MTTRPMPPLWRRWPPTGLAAASATSLQAADGLQLAKEAGLLDDGSGELSLTELTAQALLRETEALQKQNFLETYDGVLVSCDSYISLRKEPSTDAARLRTIFDGKVARLLDVYDDEWYEVSYGTDTGFVLAEYCEPVHYADYEGTSATSTLIEDIIAKAYTYLGTPYRYRWLGLRRHGLLRLHHGGVRGVRHRPAPRRDQPVLYVPGRDLGRARARRSGVLRHRRQRYRPCGHLPGRRTVHPRQHVQRRHRQLPVRELLRPDVPLRRTADRGLNLIFTYSFL